jgi:hypothetical protein
LAGEESVSVGHQRHPSLCACKREGIIPLGVDLMSVHKEATALRTARNEQRQEVKIINVLPFSRAV